jgi:hypothetical protein
MTARSYLKWPSGIGSWHVLARVDDAGWHLRCGRFITTDKAQASDHLPLGERTCEPCLRLTLGDEETPANDKVPA